MVTILKFLISSRFNVFYKLGPLVSKVSMVTVFWAVTYSWRTLGKQSKHGHLFLREGDHTW